MREKKTLLRNPVILIFTLILLSAGPALAQKKTELAFNNNHIFKIVQFTDIHWKNNSANTNATIETIQNTLKTEKPQLVIITGDIVVDSPAIDGWKAISQIFEKAEIPWAITLGNHDSEPGITPEEIFDFLEKTTFFIGQKGPDLYGCGNYAIAINKSSDNEVAAVIYCFDSNAYWYDGKEKNYDWIRFDQIGWYRETSDAYTSSNNHTPIPSLAFFHIPLPEFYEVPNDSSIVGIKNEGVASARINSGLFASFIEKKDVMGVFVGHVHDDNFIGVNHGIALAFGQVTGADAYSRLERGARVIELHEGKHSFDTWIRTNEGTAYQFSYGLSDRSL
jgi:hypothetical protein